MQNTENKEIWTALYARLSMDDGNVGGEHEYRKPESNP